MSRSIILLLVASAGFVATGGELPSAYQRVDYLESWSGQYLDTGYSPNERTTLEIKVRTPPPFADCYLYGTMKSYQTQAFACAENTAFGFNVFSGDAAVVKLSAERAADFIVRQTPTGFFCDGICLKSWTTPVAFTSPATLLLFYMQTPTSFSTTAPPAMGARIYYTKIWEGDSLVRDFVPVRRISDGVGGLFDLVNATFHCGKNAAVEPFEPVLESDRTADLVIEGSERPFVGEKLTASVTNLSDCTFLWQRKSAADSPRSVVSTSASYLLTAADREHWLIVSAISNGVTVARDKLWISALPVVYINTDGAERIADKARYRACNLRIQGNAEFAEQYNGRAEIKGRGNSSWSYAQKPYKLKLETKTNLFGFGKNKHWVLISNNADNSMLRNRHGSELAKACGEVGMDMTWTVVILNGLYYGVEMFAEHIRIDKNRIDIYDWEKKGEDLADALYAAAKDEAGWKKSDKTALEELMSTNLVWIDTGVVSYGGRDWPLADYGLAEDWDLSGGYLYEMEARADGVSTFRTAKLGTAVNFGRPEYANTSSRLTNAAERIWNDFESAYTSHDGYVSDGSRHYTEFVDVDSMAAYWLTLECLGNYDAHRFSRYSYIDCDGRLKFGPVWDFDVGGGSVGAIIAMKHGGPDNWAICTISNAKVGGVQGQNFFCEWLDDPVFAFKAYDRYWRTVRPWLAAEIAPYGGIDTKTNYLAVAAAAHDQFFKASGRGFAGVNGDVAKYRKYLTTRLAWLDQQFASVDALMTSVRNASSVAPYTKADDQIQFVFARASLTNVVSSTDYAWTAADLNLTVSTMVSGAAIVDVAVNGLRQGRLKLAEGVASLKLPAASMTAWATNRVIVTAVVRHASGFVLARNYATVDISGASPVTMVTDRNGNETEKPAASAGSVIADLRSGEKAIVSGATVVEADNENHRVVLDGEGCPIKEYYDAKVTGVQIEVGLNDAARPELGESEPGKGDQFVVKDGEMSLGVKTQAGLTYTLQKNNTPGGESDWQDVETVVGDGTVKRLTTPATSERGFYRLNARD